MVRSEARTLLVALLIVVALGGLSTHVEAAKPDNRGAPPDTLSERHPAAAEARRSIDPGLGARLRGELERRVARGTNWPETLFNALSVMAAQIDTLERDGILQKDRVSIGAFLTVSVLELMIDLHPELRDKIDDAFTEGLSPIERMCDCDKRGSRACGCLVISTGAGSCEYKVSCPTFGRAFCSAVNVELCVADTITNILF